MRLLNGNEVDINEFNEALKIVAEKRRQQAYKERLEPYASHITEERKDELLNKALRYADEIEAGEHNINFTVMQQVTFLITGECVALFGGVK